MYEKFLSHLPVPLQVIYDRVEFPIKKCVDLLANDVTGKRFEIKHHHSKKTLNVSKNAIPDWFYEFLSKSDTFLICLPVI